MKILSIVPIFMSINYPILDIEPKIYSGKFVYSFETYGFQPWTKNEYWRITGDESGMSRAILPPNEENPMGFGSAEITFVGILEPGCHHGRISLCKRLVHVIKVIDIKNRQPHY